MDLSSGLVVPFEIGEHRERYIVSRVARDRAFRTIVLEEYRNQCAVCQSMFILRETERSYIEAEAAHIVSVPQLGPDDPRNGLSLCRRHHWAFDNGFFCVTDSMEVRVSPTVKRAVRERFDLEEYDTQPLIPPAHESCRPSLEAVEWHRRKVFKAS
ncbi:MAG: HNH endonuclease [Acidobacteriota bacterium]